MFRLSHLQCLGLLFIGSLQAQAGMVESAHSRYYSEPEIRPVGHYLGGELEMQRFRQVVVSHSDDLAGHYFILKVKEAGLREVRSARITFIPSDSKEEQVRELPLDGVSRSWLYLGLTGADWPGGDEVEPVAWMIEFVDAAGAVLGSYQSFLWGIE